MQNSQDPFSLLLSRLPGGSKPVRARRRLSAKTVNWAEDPGCLIPELSPATLYRRRLKRRKQRQKRGER